MNFLTKGQMAPDFKGTDQNGNMISLKDFIGRTLVLYFYPKDNTPGCTNEACSFRDSYANLLSRNLTVIGISADSELSHQKFATKYELPFTLISDVEHKIVQSYGVWGEKNMYGKKYMGVIRRTFIISEDGKIIHIITKVDTKNSSTQVLALLDEAADISI